MESARMTKMAIREGFPPPARFRDVSRLAFGGYRGLRRRNSRSRFLSGSLGIYKRYWCQEQVRGSPRRPHARGTRPGGRARPHPRGCLGTPLVHLRCSAGFFWSKNSLRQISGQLDSVCFSFSVELKNRGNNKNWHWALC